MILIPHENEDFNASISRGSFRVDGMVIIRCSISCDGDLLEMEIFIQSRGQFSVRLALQNHLPPPPQIQAFKNP
jgi:hypothetical protein